ncbi:MAG: hypothetical protein ACI4K5_06450, partial [Ruminococcus sp.]
RFFMNKYETKFLDFISKNIILIGFALISVLGLLLRLSFFDVQTADYSYFMQSWINQLKSYNGLSGIGENIGEYNVPYMLFLNIIALTPFNDLYEIKILSVIFDYVGAFAVIKLISHICGTKLTTLKNLMAYSVCLFSPVFFLNSAFWAQCDFIYVSMLLFCMYFMIKEKYDSAMTFFGIALSLKLQAVFFLPVIIIYYFASKKMSARNFLFIPIIYFVAVCPALFAGRGIKDTFLIYFKQTSLYHSLTMECPNIFLFMSGDYNMFKKTGIILAVSLLGIGALICIHKKLYSPQEIVMTAVWSSMICIYFLPSMHDAMCLLPVFSVCCGLL